MSVIPERRRRRRSEVNIVPLVDVLTVLLFFFLVSMQFKQDEMLNISLPDVETAGKNVFSEQLEVAISDEGQFYFNGQPINRQELPAALRIAADINKRVPVLVIADQATQLQNVTYVMDECRKIGLEDFRLQTR